MGRSACSLTEAQIAEVETLAAVLTTEQIADYFGIGRRTFYSLMERDPEIAARYKRGRARAVGSIAQSLIAKARSGNTTAMIFFLKTQGGWRETTAVEHIVEETSPAEQSDALRRLMARLDGIALRQSEAGIIDLPPAIPAQDGGQANGIAAASTRAIQP